LFAVAASTIAVAVLVGQSLREGPQNNQDPTLSATAIPQQQMAALVPQSDKPQQQQKRTPLTAQFNDYLQAHNSSVYTNGEANFKPYTTVTSYGRE
jgi:sigma-E factor negative regulatory protein RseA